MTIDPELVARFRADLARLWPSVSDERLTLGLAVSGGGDSMGLLLLANAALNGRVRVATVDHRLRAENADEAAFVATCCRELCVPHSILTVEIGKGNVQDRARMARYDALGRWCEEHSLAGVATAHHMDDQVETVMMRLNRGSGLAGLSAIRAIQILPHTKAPLVRPLLHWRREELSTLVREAGWQAVDDPSNADDRFDRARLRKAIAGAEWLDRAQVARSAALLAQAQDSIAWAVENEVARYVRREEKDIAYAALAAEAPFLIRVETVRHIYRELGSTIERRSAARVVERLTAKQPGNVAGLQFGVRESDDACLWVFRPETPRRTG